MIRGPLYGLALVLLVAATALASWTINPRGPVARTEIYHGVFYTCETLPETDEMGGLMHVIEVDLTAPGVELFVTPPDPQVVKNHAPWTYRLRYVWQTAYRENLAAATNATFFDCRISEPGRPRIYVPGDLANTVQTIITDDRTIHASKDERLLWFEEDLTPHLNTFDEIDQDKTWGDVRFGIGSARLPIGFPLVRDGKPRYWPRGHGITDAVAPRTAIGIDTAGRRMWLITIDRGIPNALIQPLIDLGATDAIILDGGKSSTMVLGRDAGRVRPGTVTGGKRPVATVIGVRARPLDR